MSQKTIPVEPINSTIRQAKYEAKSPFHHFILNTMCYAFWIIVIFAFGFSQATPPEIKTVQAEELPKKSIKIETPNPPDQGKITKVSTENKEQKPGVSQAQEDPNYTRVFNFVVKKNKDDAEDITKACLANMTLDVCRLSLAIAVKESKLGNAYTIADSNKWQRLSRDQVQNIVERDNPEFSIRFNLWGVKYSQDRGGNYIHYIDYVNSAEFRQKVFTGSIVGYGSWDEAFKDHNRILTQTYAKHTQDEITRSDIQAIASRYLTGNRKAWTDVVFNQFNQI